MAVSGQLHAQATVSSEQTSSSSQWGGTCVGPRTGLEIFEKKEHLPCRESKDDSSVFQLVT
jgi:hypothetical protein